MKFMTWISGIIGLWGWTLAQPASSLAGDAYWKGESGGFVLEFAKSEMAARPLRGGDKGFSLAAEFRQRCDEFIKFGLEEAAQLPPDFMTEERKRIEISTEYEPRSVVGPYLTIEQSEFRMWPSAGYPNYGTVYRVIDLRQPGRPVRLTDLFAEEDVLAALRSDPIVRKALNGAKPKTLAELQERINPMPVCDYAFDPGFMDHFAFFAMKGDKVAVRIGLTHGCAAARGKLTQLGILLPVPEKLRDELFAADHGKAGFLMRDARAKLHKQSTRMECLHDVALPPKK